jgi:hypothetical protein
MTTHTASFNRSAARPRRGLLRSAFLLDAGVTGLNGIAYLAGAGFLDRVLGLDAALLRGAGAFLLVFGVAVGVLGTRARIPRPAAWIVVAVNAVWALASLAAAALGGGSPTPVGTGWILAQAVVVGGFAALQAVALRRP